MDNLEEKLNALTITEEVEVVIDCEDDDEVVVNVLLHLFLVGKLLTNNLFSVEAMKNTFKIVWRLGKGKVVREIKHGIFVFQFFSIVDKAKVLEDGPLYFACAPLLLKEVEEGIQPSAEDVPLNKRTKSMSISMVSSMGTFVEINDLD
ncbi:RNA replication protein [Bienertia sinuspersici]